jgi:hypothetical protein
LLLRKSEFDAVIFECHSYQDGIYETPEDAAGRSEHDVREGLRTVPADGIDCSRPVTQRGRRASVHDEHKYPRRRDEKR